MRTAGTKECTAHMGTGRGQSRYYYFYYIAEVLWNSSLKQMAAKIPNSKNSDSPSLLSQIGTTLFHKVSVTDNIWGTVSQPEEGPLQKLRDWHVPSFPGWNPPAWAYPWNPYTPLFRTLPCSHTYSDFRHTERLCWVKGVGVDYIYIHIFSIMIKQSGCTTATSTLLHLLITFVLFSTLSFICFIFC